MAQTRLVTGPPVASIELAIQVYPAAILTLYSVICDTFPALLTVFSRQVSRAFIVMVAGLCLRTRKPTARSIASTLGVVSHDALTRLLTHASWNASLLMGAVLNQALLMTGGSPLPSYLILDDVVIPKPFARWIAGAYWDWDHAEKRKVFCHRVVVVVWTNGVVVLPVAFALWHKRHSAYFLAPTASFTPDEYTALLATFQHVTSLLSSVVQSQEDTVVLEIQRLSSSQKHLIGKDAFAVIASHATNQHRYRTKNELARCLIYSVVRHGLCGEYITFDSWYASQENLNFLTRLGLIYYAAIPCSRKVHSAFRVSSSTVLSFKPGSVSTLAASHSTRAFIPYPQGHLRALALLVNLPGLNHGAKLVMLKNRDWLRVLKHSLPADHPLRQHKDKDPNTYLLTNNIVCPAYQVILHYRSRWAIEVMFRNLKQHLGLGACQHRSLEAVTRHIALVLFAFVCLQLVRRDFVDSQPDQAATMTIGDVKKRLQSQVVVSGATVETRGILTGEILPMPRDIFEQLTDPAGPAVISVLPPLTLESPAIKELYSDA